MRGARAGTGARARALALLASALLAAPVAARGDDAPAIPDPYVLAAEASYLEEVRGDLAAALDAYRRAAADRRADAALVPLLRMRAAGCLEQLGRDAEALEAYRALLAEGAAADPALRAQARARVSALERSADRRPLEPAPTDATAGERRPADRASVDQALDALAAADPLDRYRAIEALQALPRASVLPAVIGRLADENPRVRHYAVLLLGHLGAPEAALPLRARLADAVPDIRVNAALALWKLGDASGRPTLVQELTHPSLAVRMLAASHLTQLGDRSGAEVLLAGLEHPDGYRRQASIEALARLTQGDALGFDPEAAEEERALAVERWRAWLAEAPR